MQTTTRPAEIEIIRNILSLRTLTVQDGIKILPLRLSRFATHLLSLRTCLDFDRNSTCRISSSMMLLTLSSAGGGGGVHEGVEEGVREDEGTGDDTLN